MTISSVILLHYKERDEPNAPKIAKALKSSTKKLDRIVFFIDNPEIEFEDPEVTIIRSSHPFPVIARNSIGTLCDTDYVFYQDSDLCVEPETISYLASYAEKYPNAILGFEGCNLAETHDPYTDGETINRGSTLREADVLIRTWFVPKRVVGMSINLYISANHVIPSKYSDDLLLSLGNRYGYREANYVVPIVTNAGVIELGEQGVGQFISPGHFQTRNQVCRFLMQNRL
jgi:hypothetical protein